jgi:ABC-type uncharacterized transport system involved in gliding motility auxiliary subunit
LNRRPHDEYEASGTVLDAIRGIGRDLGALSFASVLLGILSVIVSLVLLVLVPGSRIFSYILLALGLALLVMGLVASRRRLAESVTGRQGRYGANTILMILAFLAIVAILNFVAFDNPARLDVTSTKQFSLAPRTVEILQNLEQDIEAIAFFDENDELQEESLEAVENMLHAFAINSDRFSYDVINLDVEPARARDYRVNQHGQVAFVNAAPAEGDGRPVFEVVFGAIHIPGDPTVGQQDQFFANPERNPQTGEIIESNRNSLEQRFVTPLLLVSGTERKTAFFLVGHGERNPSSATEEGGYFLAAESLRGEGYGIETLDLQTHTLAPPQTGESKGESEDGNEVSPTLIVVAGPQKDLLPNEEEALSQYLKDGGRMLMLLDPETPNSFRAFLERWGITLGQGTIIDQEDFIGEERTPFISQYNPNVPLTRAIDRTFFPGVTSITAGENVPSVQMEGQEVPLVEFTVLAKTSNNSWLIEDPNRTDPDEDVDTRGPLFTVVLVDAYGTKGAIGEELPQNRDDLDKASFVVIGDSDFASNEHFDSASNGDLFLNSANFLAGDVSLINIRPKLQSRRELLATPNEFNVIRYTSWFLLPILMAMAGIFVWWTRR